MKPTINKLCPFWANKQAQSLLFQMMIKLIFCLFFFFIFLFLSFFFCFNTKSQVLAEENYEI